MHVQLIKNLIIFFLIKFSSVLQQRENRVTQTKRESETNKRNEKWQEFIMKFGWENG